MAKKFKERFRAPSFEARMRLKSPGEIVQYLRGHRRVNELALGNWLTEEALKQLVPHLTRIKKLSLGEMRDAWMPHLAGLTGLEALDLDGTEVTDAGMAELVSLAKLKELDIFDTKVTDAGMAHVAKLSRLKKLLAPCLEVTDAGMVHLVSLTQLEELDINGTKVTSAGMTHVASLRKLKSLNLMGTAVGNAGMTHVARLPQLEVLNLTRTKVGNAGVARLVSSRKLKTLDLSGTKITKAALDHVARLPQLRKLGLTHMSRRRMHVLLEKLAELSGLKALEALELGGPDFADEHLSKLQGLPWLRRLGLSERCPKVTDEGVPDLMCLQLNYLELGGTKITREGCEALQRVFPYPQCGVWHFLFWLRPY